MPPIVRTFINATLSVALAGGLLAAPAPARSGGSVRPAPSDPVTRSPADLLPRVSASPVATEEEPRWKRRIDEAVAGTPVGVAVRLDGAVVYRRKDRERRTPASNQKLLVSMALLDAMGPEARLPTRAAYVRRTDTVVKGDLWIIGSGDPSLASGRLGRLARRIAATGITRIAGAVVGSTRSFARDWRAPGWKPYFRNRHVALPTALTFHGNAHRGTHVSDPERRAARELTARFRKAGVTVRDGAGAGPHPGGLEELARVRSPRLRTLLASMNRSSRNFDAEVLGKRLGLEHGGGPGTIAKGARAMESWAADRGTGIRAHDASGLSYGNRMSPRGLARLLGGVEGEAWFDALRSGLPTGGQGTLGRRLQGVPVRAKTGTLSGVSALSGWVWLEREGRWAAFSIISEGLSKWKAASIEDRVVRLLWRRGRAG